MELIHEIRGAAWRGPFSAETQQQAERALEEGAVLFFPDLPFELNEPEKAYLTPDVIGKSKNVSYNPANGTLSGTSCTGEAAEGLKEMVARFATHAREFVNGLLPGYTDTLIQARSSFRPVEIAGRPTSWRKDDTRLHVDAFPATPVRDRRLMRLFCNVNPTRARVWRVGEPFRDVAARFFPTIKRPLPGSSALLNLFKITKSRRSEYDHYMLQLHDRMKQDTQYQSDVPQIRHEFPPGSTWITFTDQVSHAAVTGQHQLEQTFYLPVKSMGDEQRSPLRILEKLAGRKLL